MHADRLAGTDPRLLLRRHGERYNHRKSVLLACACCRRVWEHLTDASSRQAVQSAEEYADGAGDVQTIRYAERAAHQARRQPHDEPVRRAAVQCISALSHAVRGMTGTEFSLLEAMQAVADASADRDQERAWQCQVIRDIFAAPLPIDPAWKQWNNDTAVKLAQSIYDERQLPSGQLDAGRLAILADALEDAGCTNADILSHFRASAPHVRACWVVDSLLGKE